MEFAKRRRWRKVLGRIAGSIALFALLLSWAGGMGMYKGRASPQDAMASDAGPVVHVGKGSYTTQLPPGRARPPSAVYLLDHSAGPVPTNTWWSSALWLPLSEPLYAHPLVFRATPQGLGIGYPPMRLRTGTNPAFFANYRQDLVLSLTGLHVDETWVAGYSDWTVDLQFQRDDVRLTTRIGHGFPYVYAMFTGASPVVIFSNRYTAWWESDDRRTLGVTVNGSHYGLFCPSGGTWQREGPYRLVCRGGEEAGYVSIGLVPDADPDLLALLQRHAFVFPRNTRVAWTYDRERSQVRTEYFVEGEPREGDEGSVLLALYPHQWKHMAHSILPELRYDSPRGPMHVIMGNTFTTTHTYPGILPFLPPLPASEEQNVRQMMHQSLSGDLWPRGLGTGQHDTYWTGKSLNRVAQMLPIAVQVGDLAIRQHLLDELRARLEAWFTATGPDDPDLFYYHATLGTLIGYPASHGTDEHLNDHHFHYGYFIGAAAMVGLYDKEWIQSEEWGGMVEFLIRDWAAWQRDDPLFPFLRTFDPYAGHSWASGRGDMFEGNNQESSSEAVHAWASLILFGEATQNEAIRDLGIWGYTLETHAARYYWMDAPGEPFPPGYEPPVIGRLFGSGGDYDTWWTRDPRAVHAINILPVTGASLHLGRDPEQVRRSCRWLQRVSTEPSGAWTDILAAYCALAEPSLALDAWRKEPSSEFGHSLVHTYHWLRNLDLLGHVDGSITADHTLYAVFNKNGMRTYVAYNAGDEPRRVRYSDGTELLVAPNSLGTTRVKHRDGE